LKLKCDEPRSNVAFNFNLRRYSMVREAWNHAADLGRPAQVDPIKPMLKAPGTKLLKLKHDEPLSSSGGFKFNLRRCT